MQLLPATKDGCLTFGTNVNKVSDILTVSVVSDIQNVSGVNWLCLKE